MLISATDFLKSVLKRSKINIKSLPSVRQAFCVNENHAIAVPVVMAIKILRIKRSKLGAAIISELNKRSEY